MKKIKYLIWIIFGLLILILGAQKVRAADSDVVINEVMANAPTREAEREWIELYNSGTTAVDLNGWTLDGKPTGGISDPEAVILPESYLILARNKTSLKEYWQLQGKNVIVPVIEITSISLANSSDKITLKNADDSYQEEFSWVSDVGDNISWERIDPLKTAGDNWSPTLRAGGTPGVKNSVTGIVPPQSPTLVSPAFGAKIPFQETIAFEWQAIDEDVSFEFLLGKTADIDEPIIDEPHINLKSFIAENLEPGIYYWQVVASNGLYATPSAISSFEILPEVYSDDIIINELYPDPSSGDEWIELYNNSAKDVNLKNWVLADLKGSIHSYKILSDLIIPGFKYLLISKSLSGITLNNDQDGLRIIQPNGDILYETPIFSGGDKGWSFARNSKGTWQWTTKLTPRAANVIVIPEVGGEEEGDNEEDIPKNTEPIIIKTGEFRNYENYLVTITGTVVETSGNTFYLDDGSGKAKVYIQASTGIDKPEMHKGDIFEITGIVNLYRDAFRILPRKQDDIRLIRAVQSEAAVKSAAAKTTKASTAQATKSSQTAKTNSSTNKNQKITSTFAADDVMPQIQAIKSPWWIKLTETIIGLASVLLLVLLVKIFQLRGNYSKGNFGDDFT